MQHMLLDKNPGENIIGPLQLFCGILKTRFLTCNPEMVVGYGDSAVEPRFRLSRGFRGVLRDVCVARQ